ncbi:MAG: hypothetical protein IPO72_00070 [Saprospiraceae bacterium]|nr:hypothetical protein [Candidatus Vicinibacter affinis]
MWASNTDYEIQLNTRKAAQSLKIYELEQSRMELAKRKFRSHQRKIQACHYHQFRILSSAV